jgi:hypothetical protein
VLATEGLPEEDTEYSALGTFAHEVSEKAREENRAVATYIGWTWAKGNWKFVLDKQMAEYLQEFIDYVNGIPGDDYNEERIYYREYVKNGFGTMDAAKAYPGRAHIIDLKYGEGVQVFARGNSQLRLYALGFWLKYGWLYDIKDFVLTIFQPRLQHVDSDTITLSELLDWAERVVRPAALLAGTPNAPFKAGDWCKFCKIRKTCRTRGAEVFGALTGELEDLDVGLSSVPRPINSLSDDQIARALRVKKNALAWFSDLEKYAKAQLYKGHDVGGYKMVEGRSNRAWKLSDEETAEAIHDYVLREFGPENEQHIDIWEPRKLRSISELEEVLGPDAFRPEKRETRGKLQVIKAAGPLAHLIEKPEGKPVLAPPEDPRESTANKVIDELEDLDFDL